MLITAHCPQGYKGSKGDMGMPGTAGDKGAVGLPGLPVRKSLVNVSCLFIILN